VGAFIVTLQQQAARIKEEAAGPAATAAATLAATPELQLIVHAQMHDMQSAQASDASDGGAGEEGGGAGSSASPLLTASPPSDVDMAELSECGRPAPDADGAAKQNASRRSTMHLLEVAGVARSQGGSDHSPLAG